MAKQVFFKRKKSCPFSGEDGLRIDYKDVKLLSRYISEKGKIIPSRITSVSAKKKESSPALLNALVISACFLMLLCNGKEIELWKLSF
jgi:small subunit ribosomal protein S18